MRKHYRFGVAAPAVVAILVSGPAQARQMSILIYPFENTGDYANILHNTGIVAKKKDRDAAGRYFRQAYDIYVPVGFAGPLKERALKNAVRPGH